ncbi:hypothetical protein CALVIDRAFT_241554 [Calocera viscosa TUFC12733]|uniref:Rpr2-domain-containing protein n=1 Tax=Calocera viscosa (strain TUFC12733) TaxID=1330018 RepID=A0A167JNB1_CALVF|nr:hypothetical protein CALVIDRAFT_241554 [Calocera viscosa TUFC12733]
MASSLTSSYQQSLAAALQPVSPSLAALHNSKLREKDVSTSTLTCSHCGTFLVPGLGTIRLSRKTRRHHAGTTSRRITITCHVCSTIDHKPLFTDGETRAAFEPARTVGRRRKAAPADPPENTVPSTLLSPNLLSTPSTPIARTLHERSDTPDAGPSLSAPLTTETPKSRSQSTELPLSTHPSSPSPSAAPSPSATLKGASSRKKKKSSLQEMLERNRLEKLKKQEERDRGGLLGFLDSF